MDPSTRFSSTFLISHVPEDRRFAFVRRAPGVLRYINLRGRVQRIQPHLVRAVDLVPERKQLCRDDPVHRGKWPPQCVERCNGGLRSDTDSQRVEQVDKLYNGVSGT